MARDKDLHRKLLRLCRYYIRQIVAAHRNAEREDERWTTPSEAARGCGLAPGTFNKILNEKNPATHSLSWRTLSQMRDRSGVPLPEELVRAIMPQSLSGNVQNQLEHGATGSDMEQRDNTLNVGGAEMSYAKDTLRSLIRHFTLSQVTVWIGEIADEERKAAAERHPQEG